MISHKLVNIKGKIIFLSIILLGSQLGFSLEVNNYYGNYEVTSKKPWQFATSLSGPYVETWQVPVAKKSYKILALVPQLQDSYWLGVNYALIQEAKQLGLKLKILDAGGYDKGGVQRRQLTEEVLKEQADGVLLASIFYDKLDRFIEQLTNLGVPIVGMINDVLSPHVKAAVTTSYYDIGYKLGEFIIDDAKGKDIRIAFFPGPKAAVWATDTYAGFLAAVKANKQAKPVGQIRIVAIQYAAMTKFLQQQVVDKVLELKPKIDYLIGNALAAKAASELCTTKYKNNQKKLKIIATYVLADIYDLLKVKKIYAAVLDFNMDKARMALHLLIRYLNGEPVNQQDIKFPLRTTPLVKIVTKDSMNKYPRTQFFPKANFKPIYEVSAEINN